MSCHRSRYQCPRERTRELYRGLVKQSRLESGNTYNERMRLRVLEVLEIPSKSSSSKKIVHKSAIIIDDEEQNRKLKKKVTHEHGVIIRSEKKQKQKRPHRYSSRSILSPVNESKHKKKGKKSNRNASSSKFVIKEDNYIWHPLQLKKETSKNRTSCNASFRKDVMKHFRNQYHKQGAASRHS